MPPVRAKLHSICITNSYSILVTCFLSLINLVGPPDIPLDLKSLSGVTLETGSALVLTCQAGADSNQANYYDVVWRLNGTIISNNSGIMTSFSSNTHYLQVDPVLSSYSGTYSCELNSGAAVEATLNITVTPGMNILLTL